MAILKSFFTNSVMGFLLLAACAASAQMGPEAPPAPLTFEMDSLSKKPKVFDYNLDVSPFTHSNRSFTDLKGKKAIVFYFSAKCPHCQKATPHILELAKKLKKDSVTVYALAVTVNTEQQLAEFVSGNKMDIPLFHDQQRAFARSYGTGRVPLILLLNKKGHYMQINGFNEQSDPERIHKIFSNKELF